jgi:hypothetical protein
LSRITTSQHSYHNLSHKTAQSRIKMDIDRTREVSKDIGKKLVSLDP